MNIQIRVGSAQALRQVRAMDRELTRMETGMGRAAGAAGMFGRNLAGLQLARFGNQIQWTGRQLQYNWTLPILLAGGAATKFQLDVEKAFVRVRKVYGDTTLSVQTMENELKALERNFEALSNRFGVHQAEVANIGGAWAAAGASGVALAKSVKLTLETMILGEIEQAKATEALIAIQSQYSLSIDEMAEAIAYLNQVENSTGISLQGLIEGFSRAAGTARNAGIDYRHLAAMLAALTPAAGTATQAGNALRTMISRLLVPTREAAEVLGMVGINVRDTGWQSLTATQRLELLAKSFSKLDDAQKAVVSTVVASRFQINRFDVLMRELVDTNGYYAKALNETADKTKVLAQMQFELNKVLESNPRKLQIIWAMLQNAAGNIIQPLIPYIIYLANAIKNLVVGFQNLSPEVQKLALMGLLLLAAIGPIVRYVGSIITLFGYFRVTTHLLFIAMAKLMSPFMLLGAFAWDAVKAGVGGLGWAFVNLGKVLAVIPAMMVRLFTTLQILPGIVMATSRSLIAVWAATWAVIKASFIAFRSFMIAGQLALSVGMTTATALMHAKVTGIWLVMSRSIMVIAAAMRTSVLLIFGTMSAGLVVMAKRLGVALIAALTSPWTLLAAAIALAIGAVVKLVVDNWQGVTQWFYDNTRAIVDAVVKAWFALPEGIQRAFIAVINVIRSAVEAVASWLSYLNPFARHSPSLVDNVIAGVAIIKKEFGSLRSVGNVFKAIYTDLARFNAATASFRSQMEAVKRAEDRAKIAQFAPGALGSYDALNRNLNVLKGALTTVGAAIQRQEAVVSAWERALDRVNDQLDAANDKLDILRARAQAIEDQLEGAQETLRMFAEAPIKGMEAMSDAIFENELAQKQLRLEIMRMEESVGPIEDVRRQLSLLAGDIEQATGEIAGLRSGGAGSDILGPMEDHVKELRKQYAELEKVGGTGSPVSELQKQLEELQRAGEMLDLERALKFDPLTRQIEKLIDTSKELTFSEIIAGIKESQAQVARYETQLKAANRAVEQQEAQIKQLEEARKSIQKSYDAEREKLKALEDLYRAIESAINDVSGAIRDMTASADEALRKLKDAQDKQKQLTPGGEAFLAAEGANFPDVGGSGILGREGGIEDQSKLIDELTKDLADQTANMFGGLDMFGPIKKKWNEVWGWIKKNVGPVLGAVGNAISSAGSGIRNAISNWEVPKAVMSVFGALKDIGKFIWDIIGPPIIDIGRSLVQFFIDLWEQVGPEIRKFGDLLKPIWEWMKELWDQVKPILIALGLAFMAVGSVVLQVVRHTIKPLLDALVGIIKGAVKIIRGIIEFFVGIVKGDFSLMAKGLKSIVSGLWDVIKALFKGAVGIIIGIVRGFGEGIWNFLKVIWNRIKGDVGVFWSSIKTAFWNAVDWIKRNTIDKWAASFDRLRTKINDFRAKVLDIWRKLRDGTKAVWDNILDKIKSPIRSLFKWINKNLIKNVNKVTGVFGVKPIGMLPENFNKGGIVPGGGPNKDTKLAALTPGEGVLTRDTTRWLGGKNAIDTLNKLGARNKGRRVPDLSAMGGIDDFVSDVWGAVTGQVGDWLKQGAGYALKQIMKPAVAAVKAILPAGWVEDFAVGAMKKLQTAAEAWGKKKDAGAGVGGTPGSGKGMWGLPLPKGSYRIGVGLGGYPGHTGQDLPAGRGTPIFSALEGIVSRAARLTTSYGIHAFVDHPGGWQTRYAHMATLLVRYGQSVRKGQQLGTVDSTGNSTGDHLHLELRHLGRILNPRTIMGLDRGGRIPPGVSTVLNGTGDWEQLVRSTDISAIVASALVSGVNMAARDIKRAWVGNAGTVGGVGGLAGAGARVRGLASENAYVMPGGMSNTSAREIHFHGDLSFPNITDGSDAEQFLENLVALGRG